MRISKKIRSKNPSYAFVCDGDDEVWYIQMIKRNEKNLKIDFKPEIPQKKSIKEQYNYVCELEKQEYTHVFWLIDFDTIEKEQKEAKSGKSIVHEFNQYRLKLSKQKNVTVIINNPCLEFWFLLHYESTSKYFESYDRLLPAIKKYLPDYNKSQRYFTQQNNDIYLRLKPHLSQAIDNAGRLNDFDITNTQQGLSQMDRFFMIEQDQKRLIDFLLS